MSGTQKWLIALYLPVTLLLILAAVIAQAWGIPVGMLTRDMAALFEIHPLHGVISNIGVLLWCACATICLFTAVLLCHRKERRRAQCLGAFGCFTLLLTLDDLFMFHEDLAKRYLGIGEKGVLLAYGLMMTVFFFYHYQQIAHTNCGLLIVSLILFGSAILVDEQKLIGGEWLYLVEDGLKLLGITSWLGYHARTAFQWLSGG